MTVNLPEPDTQTSLQTKRRWLSRGFWALLDQGLFAGANFVIHIFLARHLDETSYGTFALAFAIFLMMGTLHTSLLTEPMMVFGSRRFGRRLGSYFHWLLRGHLILTAVLGGGLLSIGLAAWAFGERAFAFTLFALAVSQVFMLLPWMLRDACYIRGNPRPAAFSGLIYLAIVVVGLFVLNMHGWLGVVQAVLLMGVSAAIASAALIIALQIPLKISLSRKQRGAKTRHHWRYGRWAAATNVSSSLLAQSPYLLLPIMLTYAEGGAFKAVSNLVVPFELCITSMSLLVLPMMVRRLNTPDFNRLLLRLGALIVLPMLISWPLLGVGGSFLIEMLYQGRYVEYASLLWVVGALLPIGALGHFYQLTLKAAERSDLVFRAVLVSCIVFVVSAVPMTLSMGILGMAWSLLLAYTVELLIAWVMFTRLQRSLAGSSPM